MYTEPFPTVDREQAPLPVGNWMPPTADNARRQSPHRMYQQFQQDGIHPMSHAAGNPPFPQPYSPAPRPPQNSMGTASLVLGILGLLFAFLPIVGVVAWPMVILGLVFGFVGLSRVRKGRATNKGVTIAGIVTSALGLLVCILWVTALAASDPAVNANGAPVLSARPVPALATPLPDGSYGDGTYEVGAEIPKGTYKTDGPDEGGLPCTWTKAKTADVDAAPTSGDVVQGQSTVTVRTDGFMKFSGGCVWRKA